MKRNSQASNTGIASWERMIQFKGELSPSAARSLLKFGFSGRDYEKMKRLSAKARAGALSPQEQVDIDTFERLGCVLDILHSHARRALKNTGRHPDRHGCRA
jgi:hypothetical protein